MLKINKLKGESAVLRVFKMAAKNSSLEGNLLYKEGKTFKELIKDGLFMSKQDWTDLGLWGCKFQRFISFIRYWNNALKSSYTPDTLIICLYNENKEAYVNMDDILESLDNIISLDNLTGYFRLRSNKLIGLEFKDADSKMKVQNELLKIGQDNMVCINCVEEDRVINLTIHWLPPSIKQEKIEKFIEDYAKIINIEKEKNDFKKKNRLSSGKYIVKAILIKDKTIEEIPHIFKIGLIQGLITIKGRLPLCLCCEKIGHLAYNCPTPFCPNCRRNFPIKHSCVKENRNRNSYANILKDDGKAEKYGLYDEWNMHENLSIELNDNMERCENFKKDENNIDQKHLILKLRYNEEIDKQEITTSEIKQEKDMKINIEEFPIDIQKELTQEKDSAKEERKMKAVIDKEFENKNENSEDNMECFQISYKRKIEERSSSEEFPEFKKVIPPLKVYGRMNSINPSFLSNNLFDGLKNDDNGESTDTS